MHVLRLLHGEESHIDNTITIDGSCFFIEANGKQIVPAPKALVFLISWNGINFIQINGWSNGYGQRTADVIIKNISYSNNSSVI